MGDAFGHFDGELEIVRHRGRPSNIGLLLVRPVKRGVDLDGIEARGITLKMAALFGKLFSPRLRNAPASATDKWFVHPGNKNKWLADEALAHLLS